MQLDLSCPSAVPSPKSVIAAQAIHPNAAARKRLRYSMSSQDLHLPPLLGAAPTSAGDAIPTLPHKRQASFIQDNLNLHPKSSPHHQASRRDPPRVKKRRNWAPIAIVPMKNIAIASNLPPHESLQLKLHYRAMCTMEQQIFGVSTLLSLVKFALKGSADLKKIAALGRRLSKTRKRFLNVQRAVFDVQNERNASAVIPQQAHPTQNTSPPHGDVQDVSSVVEQPLNPSQSHPLQFSSSQSHALPLSPTGKNDSHHHPVIASETYGPSTQINTNINGEDHAHSLSNVHWNSPDCTTSFSPSMPISVPMPIPVANSSPRNHFQPPAALPPHHQHQNVLQQHQQRSEPTLDLNNFSAIDTREIAASYSHNHSNSQNHQPAAPQRSSIDHAWMPGVTTFEGDHNIPNVPNISTTPTMTNVTNLANETKFDTTHHHLASRFPPEEASVSKMGSAYPSHQFSVPIHPSGDMVPNPTSNTYSQPGAKIFDKIDTAELTSHDHSQSQFTLPDFSPVTPTPPQRGSLANWEASYTSSMTNALGGTATPQTEIHIGQAHNAVFEPSHNANVRMANSQGSQASMFGQYGQLRELIGLPTDRGADLGSYVNQQSEAAFFSAHN